MVASVQTLQKDIATFFGRFIYTRGEDMIEMGIRPGGYRGIAGGLPGDNYTCAGALPLRNPSIKRLAMGHVDLFGNVQMIRQSSKPVVTAPVTTTILSHVHQPAAPSGLSIVIAALA